MIGAVALAFQIAASAPAMLSVRGARVDADIPLLASRAGAAVSLDRLAPAIPMDIQRQDDGTWTVRIAGVSLDVEPDVPFVRAGDAVLPLASAPTLRDGRLLVPLELVVDVLPRLAPNRLRFDAQRGELRVVPGTDSLIPVSASVTRAPAPARRAHPPRRRLVVVDAGHGGPDNGMTGPIGRRTTLYEKDITLAVTRKLAAALRARGLDVLMTRTTDTLIALSDRGRIANQHHGDVFISIHVNAANPNWTHPADARGFETYFLAEAKTEDAKRVEQMENASVRFETNVTAPKDDPLSFVMNDMAQNEHLRESSDLAAVIQQQLGRVEPGPSRGVKQAGFRVLVTAFMPAVLVEIGFGTNPSEARFLSNSSDQREIADAIADATVKYLDQYQRRLGSATP